MGAGPARERQAKLAGNGCPAEFQRFLSDGTGNVSGILPGGLSRPFAGEARSHNETPTVFQPLILR